VMVMAVVVVVVIDLTVKSDCAIVHCSCGSNECNVESWLVYCGLWCEHTNSFEIYETCWEPRWHPLPHLPGSPLRFAFSSPVCSCDDGGGDANGSAR